MGRLPPRVLRSPAIPEATAPRRLTQSDESRCAISRGGGACLRRQRKYKGVVVAKCGDGLLHDVIRPSPDWNPAEVPQDCAERCAKNGTFSKPRCAQLQRKICQKGDYEVPIGCVRSHEDDEFSLVRNLSRYAPTKQPQTCGAQEPQDWTPVARNAFWNVDRTLTPLLRGIPT